ncbi:uncharacterized protein VTP21DRAFT_5100 [Calcarisporiella thermophila]|uniref:uncharacterized protein n=1 Tax=Calcarisporiella thermophila TaxID=911321 RepID=UPI00374202DF
MAPKISRQIYRAFTKSYGLTLKAEAARYLEEILSDTPADEINDTLDHIVRTFTKYNQECIIVERIALEKIIEHLQTSAPGNPYLDKVHVDDTPQVPADEPFIDEEEEQDEFDPSQYLNVINAFNMPKIRYRADIKGFSSDAGGASLFADASAKARVFRERYEVIRQRVLRNETFSPASFSTRRMKESLQLTAIKALLGRQGGSFLLLGMLTRMSDGNFYLEDPDATVLLDMSECTTGIGLFTESCFVLIEGVYTDDEVFKVSSMGLPPPERREASLAAHGNIDFLGSTTPFIDLPLLERKEKYFKNISFVILSDVWLDHPKTLSNIRTMFQGYSAYVIPLAFIFIGNFTSKPFLYSGKESTKYKECFTALADLIAEFPTLATFCYFIFVPGPQDPWGGNTLPRPPIPEVFTAKLRNKVKRAVFTTNPCRIKYCTQEIVILREDILNRFRRNCVVTPNTALEEDETRHLVKTLIDQSHLCPLPLHVRPTYWDYDHSLRLFPIPNLLVLADRCEQYGVTYEGCHCVNPGSFVSSDFSWRMYYPATRISERCALPSR